MVCVIVLFAVKQDACIVYVHNVHSVFCMAPYQELTRTILHGHWLEAFGPLRDFFPGH